MPRVDVVIATFNRPDRLERCLRALTQQSYPSFGVIVVDDASDPPAEQTITAELRDLLDLRVIRLADNGGPGRARNIGVRASSAEFVAFVDDDVVPDRNLLAKHMAAYQPGHSRSIQFGPLKEPRGWKPTPWNLWEARTLESEYSRMQAGVYEPTWRQFFTGNAFVPRETFLAVGGFDESFTRAEDIEFAYRVRAAGGGVRFVPDAVGWHYAERPLSSWLKIARDYARFDLAMDRIHPEIGWRSILQRERLSRNPISRVGYEALRRSHTESAGIQASIGLARAVFALRLPRIALPLLSFAYSVEYERSFASWCCVLPSGQSGTPSPSTGAAI